MIAFLQGKVQEINQSVVILLVNGVGYEVYTSSKTQQKLQLSQQTQLWIYTHVKEDALKLYGFFDLLEKRLFIAFIGINGIGPKMALVILSAAPGLKKLFNMIENEDINGLIELPRVGKKSAWQIVLALKGKFKEGLLKESEEKLNMHKSLTSSLLHLGFRSVEIKLVIEQMESQSKKIGNNLEEQLKLALSYLQPR